MTGVYTGDAQPVLPHDALALLRTQPVDLAVIIIGANDTEGLFDDDHKHAYPLMSPGWKAIYGARIDRLVALQDPAGTSWWVLDYKLQGAPAADAANREQLQRYVDAVQRLQPGERVRGAFITGAGELVEP